MRALEIGAAGKLGGKMTKISGKEYLILSVCVTLPAGGYGLSYFVFDYSWRGMALLTLAGLLIAAVMLGLVIWRGEKKNQSF